MKDPTFLLGRERKTGKPLYVRFSSLLQRHGHVMGLPGMGKTMWLTGFIQWLITSRLATVIVLDFVGTLFSQLRRFVARQRLENRTFVIDPGDAEYTPGLNIFDDPRNPDVVAQNAAWTFRGLFNESKGYSPWIEDVMSATFGLLAHTRSAGEPWTVLEALDVLRLGSSGFLQALLHQLPQSSFVTTKFEDYSRLPLNRRAEMWGPVANRVGRMRYSPAMTAMVGQPRSSIDFDRLLATNGVLLMKANDPDVPGSELSFLARVVLVQIKRALLRRRPEERKRPIFLFVDETQKLFSAADSEELGDFFEMGRNAGMNFWASHQNLTQLLPRDNPRDTRLVDALMGLSQIRVYFRTSPKDVEAGLWRHCFGGEMQQACNTPKHELSSTKFEPVLDWVEIVTKGVSKSSSREQGEALAAGMSRSESETEGESEASTDGYSSGSAESNFSGSASVDMQGHTSGFGSFAGAADAFPAGFDPADGMHTDSLSSGTSSSDSATSGSVDSSGSGTTFSDMSSASETHGRSHAKSKGSAMSVSRAETQSRGQSDGTSESRSLVPITQHRKFSETSSVTFPGTDEVKERFMARLTEQEQREFVFRLGTRPAVELQSPDISLSKTSARELAESNKRMRERYPKAVEVIREVEARVPRFIAQFAAAIEAEDQRRKIAYGERKQAEAAQEGEGYDAPKPFSRKKPLRRTGPAE